MIDLDKLWESATEQERREIVDNYNLYYADEKIPFEVCDEFWTGSRFYTIKYTFGIKPLDMVG